MGNEIENASSQGVAVASLTSPIIEGNSVCGSRTNLEDSKFAEPVIGANDHGTASQRSALRIEGLLSGTRNGRPARTIVSMDAMLDGPVFRSITIECTDRRTWDAMWG